MSEVRRHPKLVKAWEARMSSFAWASETEQSGKNLSSAAQILSVSAEKNQSLIQQKKAEAFNLRDQAFTIEGDEVNALILRAKADLLFAEVRYLTCESDKIRYEAEGLSRTGNTMFATASKVFAEAEVAWLEEIFSIHKKVRV